MLHVICTGMRPNVLRVCVGDSSQHTEETSGNLELPPLNVIIIIIVITMRRLLEIWNSPL